MAMFIKSDKQPDRTAPALVLGRIGLVRSLGRCGIPVALARESAEVFERASRYVGDFLTLPNPDVETEAALEMLIAYAQRQAASPVTFFNGESDVMLFSRHRDQLMPYFRIPIAEHYLIKRLIDKSLFARLAEETGISAPRTVTLAHSDEAIAAAERIGFPCVLKPIRQRLWHRSEITALFGYRKAILVHSAEQLSELLDRLPPVAADTMIQQYIPGDDSDHYDCHLYIDQTGQLRGAVVGRKHRIYPIGFGQGCYTSSVDSPEIVAMCAEALALIGYTGAANINLKRDSISGKFYILEINPRFSLWTIFDAECGVNLPLMQYLDATDQPLPEPDTARPTRWINFAVDRQAFRDLRADGKLGLWEWVKSILFFPGRIVFHVWALDDPKPWLAVSWRTAVRVMNRLTGRSTTDYQAGEQRLPDHTSRKERCAGRER